MLGVPSSISLPTGATSVSVTGTTFSVATQINVTVTASYNGSTGQATVTILPITLTGFSLSTLGVTGGVSLTGTVWLSDIAPAGGVDVSVTSPSLLVSIASPIHVLAGSQSASFAISTSSVTSVTSVNLTASYNGSAYTLTLWLSPPQPNLASLSSARPRWMQVRRLPEQLRLQARRRSAELRASCE